MYTGLVTVMTQIITIILFPFFCGNSPIKTDYQIFFFTFLAAILELQIYLSVFKNTYLSSHFSQSPDFLELISLNTSSSLIYLPLGRGSFPADILEL